MHCILRPLRPLSAKSRAPRDPSVRARSYSRHITPSTPTFSGHWPRHLHCRAVDGSQQGRRPPSSRHTRPHCKLHHFQDGLAVKKLDGSCSLKCCIWHRQLGHHVSPSCAALLQRGVRTMILSCRYPGWPSEEKHHPTGSATRDGGSARAALCPAAGSRTAMLSAALSV